MEIKTYFYDTYAIFELIRGNPNYSKFIEGVNFITTKLNLMELYYGLLVKHDEQTADKHYESNVDHCINITSEIIKEAMHFRKNHKNKDLSYIDCVGYIAAKKNGTKFLTGDKEFEYLDNVEFVK